jgi:DNA-3-methyladenine glycosylase II
VPIALDPARFADGVRELARIDTDIARIVADFGPPQLIKRPATFATLLLLILEQQVSLASARATFARLKALADPLTPENLLALDDAALRSAGLSRQKARYAREIASAVTGGALDLGKLRRKDDDAVRAALVRIIGIGPWTADVYLLIALGRPDVWPVGDMGLAAAVQDAKRLKKRPDPVRLLAIGEAYRPWRSVAARTFWHYYLSARHRPPLSGRRIG